MPEGIIRPRVDRAVKACSNCRERKVRCTGGSPCNDCRRLDKECAYPPSKRRRLKDKSNLSQGAVNTSRRRPPRRVRRDEHQASSPAIVAADSDYLAPSSFPRNSHLPAFVTNAIPCEDATQSFQSSHINDSVPRDVSLEYACFMDRDLHNDTNLDTGLRPVSRDRGSDEQFEPWSWKSICSDSGSKWIANITGNQDFVAIAKKLAKQSSRDAIFDQISLTNEEPLAINEVTAEKYVNAFYQYCWEAELGIVDRSVFEARLQSLPSNQASEDDPAWFALQNTVFAAGYRSLLAKDPSVSFLAAQGKAEQFFRRALSVFIKLLIPPSNLMSIRALTLMGCYAEGFGSPEFKHFLCSNAVHLAQSRGLHGHFQEAGDFSDAESITQNWLWWTLYAFEKHLVTCSSRPSAIDDDHVNAQILVTMPNNGVDRSQLYNARIRTAQMRSKIAHFLLSTAHSMEFQELLDSVADFDSGLLRLLLDLPSESEVRLLARSSQSPARLIQTLYYRFSIFGSLIALHSPFFAPWLASRFDSDQYKVALETQVAYSSRTVAEAARKILLALRLIDVNVATPSWLAYDYPIHAAVSLFVYVLKYPTLSTATSDLDLLDMCAGHFGYISYLTSSQVSVSLPREAAHIARKVVAAARNSGLDSPAIGNVSTYEGQENESSAEALLDLLGVDCDDCGLGPINLVDMEDWVDLHP